MTYAGRWPALPREYAWIRGLDYIPRHTVALLDMLGTLEKPGPGDNPVIMGWRNVLREAGHNVRFYSADSVPWCGLGMAYAMHVAEREVVKDPLWALNWNKWGEPGGQPEFGDLLTFVRKGGGHVAQYIAEDRQGYYHVLGCNQSDAVNIARIAKARMSACRQPPYINKPDSVVPVIVAGNGAISTNEA